MKFRHLLTGTLFTISLLAATAFTSLAAVSMGRFDTVDASAIAGWAYNSGTKDEALDVHIVITDKHTGNQVFESVVSASQYRQDLYDRHMGNGCHGFTVEMDWTTFPEGVYLIQGTVGGSIFSNTLTYTNGSPQKASEAPKLVPLGVFKTTGYCPCYSCSEGWGRHTSTGAMAASSHTVAVDPRVIPYGTRLMINGVIYTAEDRGGGVKGNHIDIFFDTHGETRQHGMQHAEVFLVQP